jgi:hypothetical protein
MYYEHCKKYNQLQGFINSRLYCCKKDFGNKKNTEITEDTNVQNLSFSNVNIELWRTRFKIVADFFNQCGA